MTIRLKVAEILILKHVFEDILEDIPKTIDTAKDDITITLTETTKGYKVSVSIDDNYYNE